MDRFHLFLPSFLSAKRRKKDQDPRFDQRRVCITRLWFDRKTKCLNIKQRIWKENRHFWFLFCTHFLFAYFIGFSAHLYVFKFAEAYPANLSLTLPPYHHFWPIYGRLKLSRCADDVIRHDLAMSGAAGAAEYMKKNFAHLVHFGEATPCSKIQLHSTS